MKKGQLTVLTNEIQKDKWNEGGILYVFIWTNYFPWLQISQRSNWQGRSALRLIVNSPHFTKIAAPGLVRAVWWFVRTPDWLLFKSKVKIIVTFFVVVSISVLIDDARNCRCNECSCSWTPRANETKLETRTWNGIKACSHLHVKRALYNAR